MAKGKVLQTVIEISGDVDKSLTAAVDKTINRIDKMSEETERSAKAAKKFSDGYTVAKNVLANLASSAIEKAASGLKNLAASVVDTGMGFSSSMSEVQALSGATGEELKMLEDTARRYGATTVFSAAESADALKYMSLAGWDAEQSAGALGGVLNLAAASGMELAEASDMVTDYMSAFGMEANQSAYFADLLAYAQANSNTSAAQLGEAYKNSAASLNAAGQDIETVTSLLEAMANQGTKGSEAGTQLKAMMRDLTAKMKNGAVTIGKTNVEVMDAQGNYRDLTDILRDVSNATDGMGDAQRAAALSNVFTSDSMSGLNLILNEGIDKVAGYEEALRGSTGAAKKMSDIMNDNMGGDIKNMQSAFDELKLKIFDGLEGPLRNAVQVITNRVIPKLEELFQKAEPVFTGILDQVGPVMTATIDFAEKGIALVTDNIDILIPVVAGLTAAFVAYKAISAGVAIYEGIKTAALATGTTVTGLASAATWALNGALAVLTSPVFLVVAAIGVLVAAGIALYRNWDTVKEYAAQLGAFLSNVWTNISTAVSGFLTGIKDGFFNAFSSLAGIIKGPINTVISIVNGAIGAINKIGFDVPSWVPLIGGKKFALNIPTMPMLYTGGFTNGPSIAGEAGREAVISFDPAYRADNLSYWAEAGRLLGADESNYSLGGKSGDTNIDLGGVTFAPNITITGQADKGTIMDAIEAEYPEFIDMLEEWLMERGRTVYA